MAEMVFGDYEGGIFDRKSIREVGAIEEVTGIPFEEALDRYVEQPFREECPADNCSATVTSRFYMHGVSIDTGMGGFIPGESLFVKVETACGRGAQCACSDAGAKLAEGVQELADTAQNARKEAQQVGRPLIEAADRKAERIRAKAEEEAQRIESEAEGSGQQRAATIFEGALANLRKPKK